MKSNTTSKRKKRKARRVRKRGYERVEYPAILKGKSKG